MGTLIGKTSYSEKKQNSIYLRVDLRHHSYVHAAISNVVSASLAVSIRQQHIHTCYGAAALEQNPREMKLQVGNRKSQHMISSACIIPHKAL